MSARKTYRSRNPQSAFTLVELLVVIAIIGVLVALLLPAIQAAREAARRSSCKNNLKNVALSILNHHESLKVLPTGGSSWGVFIEEYVENGQPLGTSKQGLGWMYQILPYLEQGALKGLVTSASLGEHPLSIYNCPSRRGAVTHGHGGYNGAPNFNSYLTDYSAVQPCTKYPASGTGITTPFGTPTYIPTNGMTRDYLVNDLNAEGDWNLAKNFFYQWSGSAAIPSSPIPGNQKGPEPQWNCIYDGAIIRSPWRWEDDPSTNDKIEGHVVGRTINLGKVSDGTSNTMLVGEKWVRSDTYETGTPSDDTGWTDGWDPDAMRLSGIQPMSDSDSGKTNGTNPRFANFNGTPPYNGPVWENFMFGSAHPGAFQMSFCDGSVQSINYDVDIWLFNSLGTRNGEESVNMADLNN